MIATTIGRCLHCPRPLGCLDVDQAGLCAACRGAAEADFTLVGCAADGHVVAVERNSASHQVARIVEQWRSHGLVVQVLPPQVAI